MRDKAEKKATVKKGLEREKRAKDFIIKNLLPKDYTLTNFPNRFGEVDWVLKRDGKIEAYLEIKTRNYPLSSFFTFDFECEQSKVAFAKNLPYNIKCECIVLTNNGKWFRVDLRNPDKQNVLDTRCHGGKDVGVLARWKSIHYKKVGDLPSGMFEFVWGN